MNRKIKPVGMMSESQKRFLFEELNTLTGYNSPLRKELPHFVNPRKPPYVRQYEHKVAMMKAKHERASKAFKDKFSRAVAEVRRAIHFGNQNDALSAIDKLSKDFR